MSAFGKKLRLAEGQDVSVYVFWCPACGHAHGVHVAKPGAVRQYWQFNNDPEKPTFSPSVLVYEYVLPDGTVYQPLCHSFVTAGMIQFCGDSKHALAGQTVPLPDWPSGE